MVFLFIIYSQLLSFFFSQQITISLIQGIALGNLNCYALFAFLRFRRVEEMAVLLILFVALSFVLFPSNGKA